MKRYGFIYLTTNLITGKIYVGQKRYERQNKIAEPFPSYKGSGRKLLQSIKKHGKENFKRTILCWCLNQQSLDDLEMCFIKMYDSMNPDVGYNLVSGGQSLVPIEMRENTSGENNPNYGNKWTEEQKKRLSDLAKLRDVSGANNPNYGKKWSKEKRDAMSKRQTGVYAGTKNPRATKILCVETGEVFDMINLVAEREGIKAPYTSTCIKLGKKINGKTYIKLNNSPS